MNLGGDMQIFLSTLTEVDYDKSLDSIERNYDQDPETSWKERARVKNLRKSENYNYELEVIAKNESNEVVGHVLLAEITLTSQNDKQTALAIGALSVNSEVREQGLGKALIQAVEERAKAQGYEAIFVLCDTDYFENLDYKDAQQFDIGIDEEQKEHDLYVKFLNSNGERFSGMTVELPEVLK
ncbi:N-acetyltransferase [Staphylococcus caprae]|nr:N-acetyltransferase [Staphylococcus caprae]